MCFQPACKHYPPTRCWLTPAIYSAPMMTCGMGIIWCHIPLSEFQVRCVVDDSGGTSIHTLSFETEAKERRGDGKWKQRLFFYQIHISVVLILLNDWTGTKGMFSDLEMFLYRYPDLHFSITLSQRCLECSLFTWWRLYVTSKTNRLMIQVCPIKM